MENQNEYLEEYQEVDIVNLDTIHQDLGIITSFLIIFLIVLVLHYIYKFFNMFF